MQTFNFILVVVVGSWVWWWWQKIVNAALKAKAWTFEAKAKATGAMAKAKAKAIGPEAKAKITKIGFEAPRGQGLASRTTSLARTKSGWRADQNSAGGGGRLPAAAEFGVTSWTKAHHIISEPMYGTCASTASVVTVGYKSNIAKQETKQLFLSSRKYLFHSQIASAIDPVNQIFYEYDSSNIPAYMVHFFSTDCHTRHGVHVWAIFITRQHTNARYWYSKSVHLSVRLSVTFRYLMKTA